ncbi:MAG: hydroxyacid dehydrogenase [Spirochaetia bacterium]|nr:hydroxyacid dehydrogenase [Spirochaetia bacterium]
MNILFYSHLTAEFPEIILPLKESYPEHDFIYAQSKDEYLEGLKSAHVLIYGNLSPEDAEIASSLKLLIIPFTGTAHLDLDFFRERGILVANSPGNGSIVAERALALAMAVCGRVLEFHIDMSKGDWHRTGNPQKPFDYWFSMQGKQVSILGTGDIGQGIAKLLKGFDCKIKGYRRETVIPQHFDSVTASIDEALEFAEILFIALPISSETDNLINQSNIDKLNGSFLINVGRGKIVNEAALYEALSTGKLAGAGLDVWYDYPSKAKPLATGSALPFHTLPNVVISPHAASHTPEGKQGQLMGVLRALESYLKKGVPDTLLT